MNRYVADGLLADMRLGKHVLVLCDRQMAARAAMFDMLPPAGSGEGVCRTNGAERIENDETGGRIWFRTWPTGAVGALRGLSVDVVFFDMEAHLDVIDRVRCELGDLPDLEVIRR